MSVDPTFPSGTGTWPIPVKGEIRHVPLPDAWSALFDLIRQDASREALSAWLDQHPWPYEDDEFVWFCFLAEGSEPLNLSVIGDFNEWNPEANPLVQVGRSPMYLTAAPARWVDRSTTQAYKFARLNQGHFDKMMDPMARYVTFNAPGEYRQRDKRFREFSVDDSHGASRAYRQPLSGLVLPPPIESSRIEQLRPDLIMTGIPLIPRPAYVYLPPGYDAQPDRAFPVVIMNDGQNIFDDPIGPFGGGCWELNRILDAEILGGRVEPLIVVGIANTIERRGEYTPAPAPDPPGLTGDGPMYLNLIVDRVLPTVRQRYRVLPGPEATSIGGSSLGGLIAFWGALQRPDVFGKAICMSPSFWFQSADGMTMFSYVDARGHQPVKIYLDNGTGGASRDGAPLTRLMRAWLIRRGWRLGVDAFHLEQVGAEHHEAAWRDRLPAMLRLMYPRVSGTEAMAS